MSSFRFRFLAVAALLALAASPALAVSWGLDAIDQRELPLDGVYWPHHGNGGSGYTIYVIGT